MLDALKELWADNWQQVIRVAIVVVFGLVLIKVALAVFGRVFKKSHMENIVKDFILSALKITLVIIYFIALLSLLGVPTTSLIAILSAAGLAISLSLQQSLSNLASGFIIISSKPFIEGDYVEIGTSGGSVEKITIIHTILKTIDNKRIVLPNSTVTTSNIINYSSNNTRRLEIIISVAYGTDIELVKRVIREAIESNEMILKDPAPFIRLSSAASSSLDFALRVWVNRENFWDLNFDLREQVVKTLVENHIEIPFNQLDVNIRKD